MIAESDARLGELNLGFFHAPDPTPIPALHIAPFPKFDLETSMKLSLLGALACVRTFEETAR